MVVENPGTTMRLLVGFAFSVEESARARVRAEPDERRRRAAGGRAEPIEVRGMSRGETG